MFFLRSQLLDAIFAENFPLGQTDTNALVQ
jgi:hypothetical protein